MVAAPKRAIESCGNDPAPLARGGVLHVVKSATGETKTAQHKHVRLLQSCVDAMATYLAEQPRIGHAPLFTRPKGGRLRRATLQGAWIAACDTAGFENFHLYDLRHTSLAAVAHSGGSLVAQSGGSLKDLQARGGHASVQAAMRYQHMSTDRDAEVAAVVDRRLAGM